MASGRWDITSGPGLTALGLAASRCVESGRPDRLIEDPFARSLFTGVDAGLPMLLDWPADGEPPSDAHRLHLHGSRYIGLRTRFYDDALLAAADAGARQAVLLGAGLDTRAFRLSLPADLTLYELDQPGVLAYKDDVLGREGHRPRCARTAVAVDVREDWAAALARVGFRPRAATVWIAEGLLPYLAPEAQAELLEVVSASSAPGSRLAFDTIVGDPRADGRLRGISERSGIDMEQLMAGGEAPDLVDLLATRGWTVEQDPAAAVAERYGRDLRDPFAGREDASASGADEPPWLDTLFVSAHR